MHTNQDVDQAIREYLESGPYAVVGASRDRTKFGNKVLRAYLQQGLEVYPVNPHADRVEGLVAYPDLASLPATVRGVSIITPPPVTEQVVEEAAKAGVRTLWIQPGAESPAALDRAAALGLVVIAGGPCLLIETGFRNAG